MSGSLSRLWWLDDGELGASRRTLWDGVAELPHKREGSRKRSR